MIKQAKWITSPSDSGQAVYTFEKSFFVDKNIVSATLYASAMGVYVPYVNGKRVGKSVLMPGYTSYTSRIQYQIYDVTNMLEKENRISIGLGLGWAVGEFGFWRIKNFFADHTSLIAALSVKYEDESEEYILTDETWQVYTSVVTFAEIYHGETVDKTASIKLVGNAVLSDGINGKLVEQDGEWIIEQERLAPIEVIHTPNGETVLDFGQNMAGYVEVRVKAERGSRIVLHHAEVLDNEGNFYTANYRSARNECTYVCSGEDDVFKPEYSFQGFRYVQLVEYPFDKIDLNSFRAVVVHSEMKRTGYFRCGNEKINQLYHNIIWGQKSNYLDLPTDCPQRNERLGWTGDTQVFCRTGAINYDTEKFFRKWMRDVAVEQTPEGAVKGIVPNAVRKNHPKNPGDTRISAAWGDVACVVPWELYIAYGNKEMLKEHFPIMQKWVDYLHNVGPEEFLWLGGMHYGDWLAMDAGEDSYVGATSNDLIASAFFAYSTSLLIKAGEALGKDMNDYRELYVNVRKAFRKYFMENGMPKEEFPYTEVLYLDEPPIDTVRKGVTQTALTLILHFDLCDDHERPVLAKKLVEMIRDNGMRMTTGFVGTPYLLHALSENGYTDIAYELLYQEKNPSWLYSVTHGGTTMWEHWDSLKEDGTFWDKSMNSFNHYAYGAVYDWIFGVACGIKPVAPAYKIVDIAPHPDKRLGYAQASIDSRNGKIEIYWYYKEDKVYYEITIPENVTARLTLPSGYNETLSGGVYHFAE